MLELKLRKDGDPLLAGMFKLTEGHEIRTEKGEGTGKREERKKTLPFPSAFHNILRGIRFNLWHAEHSEKQQSRLVYPLAAYALSQFFDEFKRICKQLPCLSVA